MQQPHWVIIEKTVLPLLFLCPSFIAWFVYWSMSRNQTGFLEAILKPVVFTLILFWFWRCSSQKLLTHYEIKESQ